MPVLDGYTSAVQFVPGPAGGSRTPQAAPSTTMASVVDGVPVRVCTFALAAAAGLVALHIAGWRFNVGVSG